MQKISGRALWMGALVWAGALAGCVVPVQQASCDADHPCPTGQACDTAIQLCYLAGDSSDGGAKATDGGVDPGPPVILTETLKTARPNEEYLEKVTVDGGVAPLVFALSSKPTELSWLSVDPATGALSGTVSSTRGDYPFTVQVRESADGGRSASKQLTLHVIDCTAGETSTCTASTATACIVGARSCQDGGFGPCENTAVSTDVNHCGSSCGSCGPSALSCVNGACACGSGLACSGGKATCCPSGNSAACTDLQTDVSSCGSCGHACLQGSRANTTPTCAAGACAYPCTAQHADCNNSLDTDGCEVDLQNDANNCSACNNKCPAPTGGSAVCNAGACGQTCPSNLALCPGSGGASNACLDTQTDKNNCGSCGNVCPTSVSNASAVSCTGGACTATCLAGRGDCDGKISTGCETNTMTDDNNCGACGHACNVAAGEGCSDGQCVPCGQCGLTKKCCTSCDSSFTPPRCL